MIELPRPLAPWAPQLSMFPLETSAVIGTLVQRIAAAIAPPSPSLRGGGDPDGFSGLTSRGKYERLLHSEWLLADEIPDEFQRRAVMREHLFFEIARTHAVDRRVSVALFDAGPNQLGSARLAHLAALVVLARRATTAGLDFRWGVLQEPQPTLHEQLTRETVSALVEVRSPREASSDELEALRQLAGLAEERVEIWIVGGRRLRSLLREKEYLIEVEERFSIEERVLDVQIRQRGQQRQLALDLPEPRACARVIRDPFASAAQSPIRHGSGKVADSSLIFGASGQKLLTRASDGSVIVHSIPNSPRATTAKPKSCHVAWDTRAIAASWIQRNPYIVAVGNGFVRAGRASGAGAIDFHPVGENHFTITAYLDAFVRGGGLQHCWSAPRSFRIQDSLVFRDLWGTIWATNPAEGILSEIARDVIVLTKLGEEIIYVRQKAPGELEVVRGLEQPRRFAITSAASEAYLSFNFRRDPWLLGVRLTNGTWSITSEDSNTTVEIPSGYRVVGVTGVMRDVGPAALVAIDEELRSIALITRKRLVPFARTPSPVRAASVDPRSTRLAIATTSGELLVYSLATGALLYHLVPEAS